MTTLTAPNNRPLPGKHNTAGWIVAGGQGTRMGGVDKCLLPWRGDTLLAHTRARLQPQVTRCVLNANGDVTRFYPAHWPSQDSIIADREPHCGPLSGIHAGLSWLQDQPEQWLLTVPADCPDIDTALLSTFANQYRQQRLLLACAGGHKHPLFGVWHRSLLVEVTRALQDKNWKLMALASELGAGWVAFEHERHFHNINTQADFEALIRSE